MTKRKSKYTWGKMGTKGLGGLAVDVAVQLTSSDPSWQSLSLSQTQDFMMQRLFAHWNCQGSQELLLQSASSDPSIQSLSPSHFHAAGKQYRFTSYQSIALCPIVELTRGARTRNSARIHCRIRISDALIRQLFLFESEIAFVVIAATFTIGHRRRSDGTYNQNIEVSWNRCTQNSFYFCRLAIGMGHSSLIAELVTQKARTSR